MICLVVKFVFKDGKINEFIDILRSPDGLAVTRAAKGCQFAEASISEDGGTVYIYERWDSKEDNQAYLKFRTDNGLLDALEPMLAEPMGLTYSDYVEV